LPRSNIMSDANAFARPGDDADRPPGARKAPSTHSCPRPKSEAAEDEEDAVNLLDDSAEPTDDSPTVISRNPQRPSGVAPAAPVNDRLTTLPRSQDPFSGNGLRGRRLAHFELIEPIGVGGMAAVLRARDLQLDRHVALKILPPEMAADAENIRRFHQEARSAARLDHENIARVFFCGEDQQLHFIAFEFVEGDNLRTILERRGRLPVAEALHYMLQVAAGLAHAAARGVVHRDIKPSNIIITPNGRAKLVDMGLARSLEPQHDMGLTQSGVTLGTFDYISPEQALEPRDADVRSDIYSLGCTFYHMLTGQPPVPEGTAAKKLHHHQHVKPADPRQFVPDLPDEVAVILDRMIAKQPKDRYQSPEQLVHHLLIASRKLGAAADVPEGVLAVEAALPNPPSGRPLLLAAVAAVALVALIFLLDQPGTPRNEVPYNPHEPRVAQRQGDSAGPDRKTPPKLVESTGSTQPAQGPLQKIAPLTQTAEYRSDRPTAADLAKFLKDNAGKERILIELADDLDLSERNERGGQGLLITNPRVTIRGKKSGPRPTILFSYDDTDKDATVIRAPLTIQSQECLVEGIRFVLDRKGSEKAMASLVFRGPIKKPLQIRQCEFIQAEVFSQAAEKNRLTSVLVDASSPCNLDLTECCFLGFGTLWVKDAGRDGRKELEFGSAGTGGQDAVVRRGAVNVKATNCAFGPHESIFRLEGPEVDGRVEVDHCSVLTGNQSVVFDVIGPANAQIVAKHSLFSHPGNGGPGGMADGKGALLLRQAENGRLVTFEEQGNRYHQLDGYWVVAGNADDANWENFQGRVTPTIPGEKEPSSELEKMPWKDARPLTLLEKQPAVAFQVYPSLRDLRLPNGRLIGVERLLSVSYLANLPPLETRPPEAITHRELIVMKLEEDRPRPASRIYPSLGHALLDARPGDSIVLRHNGELLVDPQVLDKPTLTDLTIRADRGFHPVLTLSEAGREVDPALFRVLDWKLQLEGLEIRLRPSREGFDSQTVVALLGDGDCTFKDCLITLDRGTQKTALAVALMPEPAKLMKMSDATPERSSDQGPRLNLENCLVRGDGDLTLCRSGRAAEVAAQNCLIALTGSFLSVEANKELVAAPTGNLIARVNRVTTCLGGHFLRVRATRDLKDLARIQCSPSNCAFLPLGGDRSFVHLEGPEGEKKAWDDKVEWGANRNLYGSFGTLLEQQAAGFMEMPQPWSLGHWKTFTQETDSEYNVKVSGLPSAEGLSQMMPSALKLPEEWRGEYGADPTLLLKAMNHRAESK
jgi:serine/threonine protein kinase